MPEGEDRRKALLIVVTKHVVVVVERNTVRRWLLDLHATDSIIRILFRDGWFKLRADNLRLKPELH
jgi:hypothetical protein